MEKVIIVTGAAGGLGRALVVALARRGYRVAAFARQWTAPGAAFSTALFDKVTMHQVDVRDEAALMAAVNELSAISLIYGVFANAAVHPRGSFTAQAAYDVAETLDVNVNGVINTCRAILPHLMRNGRGRIVILGSFAWRAPTRESWAYSLSKAAVHSLVKAIAAEVEGDYPDILVNEWVPGELNTRMGIAEGIDPMVAAAWGVELIEQTAGVPTGTVFFKNQQVDKPRSLRQRIVSKIKQYV